MNHLLRRIAVGVGLALLVISIYWSAIGFKFDLAGDAGTDYATAAMFIAYVLAVSGTVIQFIFSTNYKELNATLIFLGLVTYVYSIVTNKWGIIHFQGSQPSHIAAWLLATFLDIAPEPLIAWGLYESQVGDFLSNLGSSLMGNGNPAHKKKGYSPRSGRGNRQYPKG